MRPAKKSRERGLFKECRHLSWDRCACPWLGRFRHERRVNLAKWAGLGKRVVTRSEAIDILAEVRGAILKGEFDPGGKAVFDTSSMTFGKFLDRYQKEEVEKRGLTNKALPAFLRAIRAEFEDDTLEQVGCSPRRVEQWMESLRQREVLLSHKTEKTRKVTWSARTWNAYRTMGTRLFNWARHPKQRLTTQNPFPFVDRLKGERHRETRITEEQQRKLLEVCHVWMTATRKGSDKPNAKLKRRGREMYRRLLAAFETGLRAGEMGLVQVKHINYVNWKITLPWMNAKGGKTTGLDELVWVMGDRLRKALEERRFLGADAYVFGTDTGKRVKRFHKSWRSLFQAAGLPTDLIWHDARHEFVSSLIEEGGTIQEVKEAARHKSITTTAKYMKANEERLKLLLEKRAERLDRV